MKWLFDAASFAGIFTGDSVNILVFSLIGLSLVHTKTMWLQEIGRIRIIMKS